MFQNARSGTTKYFNTLKTHAMSSSKANKAMKSTAKANSAKAMAPAPLLADMPPLDTMGTPLAQDPMSVITLDHAQAFMQGEGRTTRPQFAVPKACFTKINEPTMSDKDDEPSMISEEDKASSLDTKDEDTPAKNTKKLLEATRIDEIRAEEKNRAEQRNYPVQHMPTTAMGHNQMVLLPMRVFSLTCPPPSWP